MGGGASTPLPNRKDSLYYKRKSKRIGCLGDPMPPVKTIRKEGSFGFNSEELAPLSSQENRKGMVLGLYVKRPGLENL